MNKQREIILTRDYVSKHAQQIEKLLQRAINHALQTHRRLGNPIAVWKNERVIIIPPQQITLSPDESGK